MDDQPIRALSIRQPWAWAITKGWKPVENRTWKTSYRGPLAIHAGLKEEAGDLDWIIATIAAQTGRPAEELLDDYSERRWLGCYVGSVTMTGCVTSYATSPWFFGPYGFVLERALSFRSAPWPGQRGIYTVPEPAAEEILRLLVEALHG